MVRERGGKKKGRVEKIQWLSTREEKIEKASQKVLDRILCQIFKILVFKEKID